MTVSQDLTPFDIFLDINETSFYYSQQQGGGLQSTPFKNPLKTGLYAE
jgi:hypothetical protein